jgi:ubiquinone/menaquinone biosynthesis C-methylase UbiE
MGEDQAPGRPTWTDIADWYGDLVDVGSPAHDTALAALLELTPAVGEARILDLACGQGLAARALAQAGATVTGLDLTERLLERAADATPPVLADRITWVNDDAQHLGACADASFDGVTCNLALMDLPDLDAAIRQAARVLREPSGWLVFTITHPCFLAPHASWTRGDGQGSRIVHDYLEERIWRSDNPDGVRRVGSHHRTVSTYVNALADHGFTIERMFEPSANDELAAAVPGYRRIPPFLAVRARLM